MQKNKLQVWIRIVLIICGLALIPVLFVPMWRIELVAPQYPEGLMLLIFPDRLGGNVDIINGLNHYIGMKTLHTANFIEFRLLPYFIGFFALAFIFTGIMGKRKLLNISFILFVSFGILAMYDFWRWEYNYGHNLNPDAAIIVPGMAYQPPLIGFKQLLNFGAYSIPDLGGWIFVAVGVLVAFCTLMAWKKDKRKNSIINLANSVVLFFLLIGFTSCNTGPDPLKAGIDQCYSCKMTISDERFGAELITKKGKVYKFDDPLCLFSLMRSDMIPKGEIRNIYLSNYCKAHQLININNALFLKSSRIRGPMGGDIAAFDDADSLKKMNEHYKGVTVSWSDINKQ